MRSLAPHCSIPEALLITAKFQELQSSLTTAQRSAKELQAENSLLQTRAMEAMENLEMATLDREVAEEKAETSELELEKMNEKLAEMEIELAILKEENGGSSSPGFARRTETTSDCSRIRETGRKRWRKKLVGFCAIGETQ